MAPWIFFLFVGVLDFGFYSYAVISVENAARVAALRIAMDPDSAADAALARRYVCAEMAHMPNSSYNPSGSTCNATYIQVTTAAQPFAGVDGLPAVEVAVTYTTIPLIPIPGLVQNQLTITRVVQTRLLS